MTAEELIKELGGTVAVATALELAPTTVSSWKTSGSIPKWRMDGIRAMAREKGITLPDTLSPTPKADAA
jgi:hypothetical protein